MILTGMNKPLYGTASSQVSLRVSVTAVVEERTGCCHVSGVSRGLVSPMQCNSVSVPIRKAKYTLCQTEGYGLSGRHVRDRSKL